MIAGALVTALGAPLAVLLDALSYLASGAAVASIRPSEVTTATRDQSLGLRREIGEDSAGCTAITEKIREAIALVPKKSRCGPRYRPSFVWIGFATSLPWLASSPSTRGQTRSATSRSPSPVLGANAQRPCHAPWPRLCMSPPSMTYVALVT